MAFREQQLDKLLSKCRRGDGEAWEKLVEALQGLVYSVPRKIGLSHEDSSDVFQATFVALFRSLDTIESGTALPKWVCTTATREALRVRRASSRYLPEIEDVEERIGTSEDDAQALASKALDAHEVRCALNEISSKCRDLLTILYFDEDASYSTVTERLGMPMGAIGPTRARCLNHLKKILERRGVLP